MADGMTGRTYLERGCPVTVVVRWGPGGGPRNVLIRRADGHLVVRPFRGLRRPRAEREDDADLIAFVSARLDEDERIAREAARKRYPRWRVWLRRLRRGR